MNALPLMTMWLLATTWCHWPSNSCGSEVIGTKDSWKSNNNSEWIIKRWQFFSPKSMWNYYLKKLLVHVVETYICSSHCMCVSITIPHSTTTSSPCQHIPFILLFFFLLILLYLFFFTYFQTELLKLPSVIFFFLDPILRPFTSL